MRPGHLALPLGVAAVLVLLAGPAAAHADLMDATPSPNSRVDEAPETLELSFSEPLEDRYTDLEVVRNGTDRVREVTIGDDRRQLTASLDELEDGVWSVRWQALSSADGHTTSGSYLLGVNASLSGADGDAGTPGADGGSSEGSTTVEEGGLGESLLRGVGFLGASLAAGVPAFALVARGVEVPRRVRARWSALAVAGAGAGALACLGLIAALAGRIELPLTLALETTPGRNLALRGLAFATAGLLLLAGHRFRGREEAPALTATGTLAALVGLLLTSLGSHAAADGVGNGLWIAVDFAHQAAVAFWIAGVAALAVAGLTRTPEASAAELIRRFSPLAVASVAVIVATGLLASVDRLTAPGDLLASTYGFALSAKVLLLVPLVALGAYHRYRLMPQLDTPGHEARDVSRLRRSAMVELGLMVVVLAAAGLMATASPPTPDAERAPYASFDDALRAEGALAQPDLEASSLETLTADQAANTTLKLLVPERIDRLGEGRQPVWLLLYDAETERPIEDADVTLQAWMPEHGHGTSPEEDPVHVHEGMYEGSTTWAMPGAWTLRVNATLPGGDVLRYTPTLYVGERADPLDRIDPVHTVRDDGYTLEVFVTPQPVQIGVQNVSVRVTPEEGALPENADVVANLDAPSGTGEGTSLDLQRWRDDAWTREDAIFTEEGTWGLLVALQGKGTYVPAEFEVDVRGR